MNKFEKCGFKTHKLRNGVFSLPDKFWCMDNSEFSIVRKISFYYEDGKSIWTRVYEDGGLYDWLDENMSGEVALASNGFWPESKTFELNPSDMKYFMDFWFENPEDAILCTLKWN